MASAVEGWSYTTQPPRPHKQDDRTIQSRTEPRVSGAAATIAWATQAAAYLGDTSRDAPLFLWMGALELGTSQRVGRDTNLARAGRVGDLVRRV